MSFTPSEFLHEIRSRGATRLRLVRFRDNRSTVWSLTQRGTVLNVHRAYRNAPTDLLDAFATLAREGGIASALSRKAADLVRDWAPIEAAIEEARARHRATGRGDDEAHCCATPDQRRYLRALYRYLNLTRFAGGLPNDIPVRLSRRMTSALGHMRPASIPGPERAVEEIALNVDLMLDGNGPERIDTLLHEMAHAADYLESGHRGHGASWRAWAERVGCRPTRLFDRVVRNRRHRDDPVTRVPPLPPTLLAP